MKPTEHLLHELPCGCAILDHSGVVTYANKTLCQVLDFPCEAIQGNSIEGILTISSRIFYQTHFFPLLKLKGEVSEIFLTLKSREGTHVPMMVNARMSNEDGQTYYVCVFATVRERQKYEEQLLAARKAQQKALEDNVVLTQLREQLETNQQTLDRKLSVLRERSDEYLQMAKVFMHDMQEPVRKISLFFDTLRDQGGIAEGHDKERTLTGIQNSIKRLKLMTNSLLDFVQVNSSDEQFTLLDLPALIQQAKDEVVKFTPVSVEIEIGELPEIEGRPQQMKTVFIELLKNALQHAHPERPLTVAFHAVVTQENAYHQHSDKYRYTDHVQIEVRDNGIGFDNKYSAYVFGLLNKIDARSAGTGLGLALCKQIISQHYGTIRAKSALGEGTTITMILPLRQIAES